MGHWLLLLLAAFVVAAIVWGVAWMITGRDAGLDPSEPDGAAVPLPSTRPLTEEDVVAVRFDTGLRGYRMAQVDAAVRRSAYDIGYKQELINVLEAEIEALREGRTEDAEGLRGARESALRPPTSSVPAVKKSRNRSVAESETEPVETVVPVVTAQPVAEPASQASNR